MGVETTDWREASSGMVLETADQDNCDDILKTVESTGWDGHGLGGAKSSNGYAVFAWVDSLDGDRIFLGATDGEHVNIVEATRYHPSTEIDGQLELADD